MDTLSFALAMLVLICCAPRSEARNSRQGQAPGSVPSQKAGDHGAPRPAIAARKTVATLEREQLPAPEPRTPRRLPAGLAGVPGLAAPPRSCSARLAQSASKPARTCGEREKALEALAAAVDLAAPERRDTALAELESCSEFPAGMIRTLRADLLRACADVLVAPALREIKSAIDADIADAMLALALTARFARAVKAPAPYAGPGTQASIDGYLTGIFRPWKERELQRLGALEQASAVVEPAGYGAAILAIARARAFRDLHDAGLDAPIPTVIKKEHEARGRYYGAIRAELAGVAARLSFLDARVAEHVSAEGIHRAPDADAWFSAQPAPFGNIRLESPEPITPATAAERIASRIPFFYSDLLLGESALANLRLLRALVESGLSPRQRRTLAQRSLSAEEAEIVAYFRATLAQRTRHAVHWDEAIALLERLQRRSPAAELVLATARSARTGPRSFPGLGAPPIRALFDVAALERLAESTLPATIRAFALNNAAWLLVPADTLPALQRAHALSTRARSLAADDTKACLPPVEGEGPFRRFEPTCALPALP